MTEQMKKKSTKPIIFLEAGVFSYKMRTSWFVTWITTITGKVPTSNAMIADDNATNNLKPHWLVKSENNWQSQMHRLSTCLEGKARKANKGGQPNPIFTHTNTFLSTFCWQWNKQ